MNAPASRQPSKAAVCLGTYLPTHLAAHHGEHAVADGTSAAYRLSFGAGAPSSTLQHAMHARSAPKGAMGTTAIETTTHWPPLRVACDDGTHMLQCTNREP